MRRILFIILLYLAANTHVYNGLNKGVCVDLFGTSYGVEVIGDPGFFANPIE